VQARSCEITGRPCRDAGASVITASIHRACSATSAISDETLLASLIIRRSQTASASIERASCLSSSQSSPSPAIQRFQQRWIPRIHCSHRVTRTRARGVTGVEKPFNKFQPRKVGASRAEESWTLRKLAEITPGQIL